MKYLRNTSSKSSSIRRRCKPATTSERTTRCGLWPGLFLAIIGPAFISGAVADQPPPVPSPASSNGQKSSEPKIQFAETRFEFGKVESGDPVKHSFIFTNIGTETLEITQVRPGCGCTTAGEWDKRVEPGKTGVIPIQFNTAGYGGTVGKSVTVTCNDPVQPTVGLQISGTVWKAIDVSTPYITFYLGPDGQSNQSQTVHIVNNLEQPVTLSEPGSIHPAFRPELKVIKEGKEYELKVTLLTPISAPGASSPVTLKTTYSKMPVLSLTAFATVQPAVAVVPTQITLPAGPLSGPVRSVVTVQNNSTNAVVLSEPSINAPGATAEIKENQPGRQFSLTLEFPAGFQAPSGQGLEATVKTSDPRTPLVRVPIFQMTLPPPIATPAKAAPAVASAPPAGATGSTPAHTASVPKISIAQSETAATNGPAAKIEFASETFDFGKVEHGKIMEHDYAFTNTGVSTLQITSVRSSCGCTISSNYTSRVEPGRTGRIPVLFNTSGMSGPVAKTLTITCNDPGKSNIVLRFTASIWKPIDALPEVAFFSFGPDAQTNQTKVVRLINNFDQPVSIGEPAWTNSALQAKLTTVRPGKEFELQLTLVPPLPPGGTVIPVTMKTDSPKTPELRVSVFTSVQPALSVLPPSIILRSEVTTNSSDVSVTVQNRSTNALVLSDPTINAKGATIKIQEVQPGRLFHVNLTFPPGFRNDPAHPVEARVKSNHPQFPVVKIPVLQMPSIEPEEELPAAGAAGTHASAPARVVPVVTRALPSNN